MKYFTAQNWENEQGEAKVGKLITHIVGWMFLFIVLLTQFPLGTVSAGERGVRLRFNATTGDVVSEGLYFRIPFIERVVKLDVKTQKLEAHAIAYSNDIQTVDSTLALNYHLAPESVVNLYKELGVDYQLRIIDPAIQESVKAATAKFTAQQLIEERPVVKEAILTELKTRLQGRYIIVDDFSIVNFDFSDLYEDAVEAKQVAQQTALKARNDLETVKLQAEQRVAQAKAEAEAIRIQAQAITQQGGKDYAQLKAIEKWNGILPSQMIPGGAVPFLDLTR